MRTAAGRAVGWFDDDFFLYYEDTDLSWRLRSRGWPIRYEPTAVLRHLHSASSTEWSPLWIFHVDRNRLLMLTKNATAPVALRAVAPLPADLGVDAGARRPRGRPVAVPPGRAAAPAARPGARLVPPPAADDAAPPAGGRPARGRCPGRSWNAGW